MPTLQTSWLTVVGVSSCIDAPDEGLFGVCHDTIEKLLYYL